MKPIWIRAKRGWKEWWRYPEAAVAACCWDPQRLTWFNRLGQAWLDANYDNVLLKEFWLERGFEICTEEEATRTLKGVK